MYLCQVSFMHPPTDPSELDSRLSFVPRFQSNRDLLPIILLRHHSQLSLFLHLHPPIGLNARRYVGA